MTPPTTRRIAIRDPSLVVLIGAAGSGKSTFAQRWFAPDEILSSDAFRAVVGRGEDDQRASRAAFAALHTAVSARLGRRLTTVVDATNVQAHARGALLDRRPVPHLPAVAIVLDLSDAAVHAQNRAREERVVPTAVVDRHLAAIRGATDDRLRAEGFDAVHRITEPDGVEVLRVIDPGR